MGMDLCAHRKELNAEGYYAQAPINEFSHIEYVEEGTIRLTSQFRQMLNIAGINFYEETKGTGMISISDERAKELLTKLNRIYSHYSVSLGNDAAIANSLAQYFKTAIDNNYTLSIF